VATTITWARKLGLDVELRSDPAALAANRERIAALYRDGQPLAAETGVSVAAASMTLARLREDGLDLPWRSQRRTDAPSTARPGPPPGR